MGGIVNTALAVSTVETPDIAAAGRQEMRTDAGPRTAQGVESGFKKKLRDCQAMIGPAGQTAADGSAAITEDGVQGDAPRGIAGIACIFEGVEMPDIPSGGTGAAAAAPGAAAAMMAADDAAGGMETASGQTEETPGQIAGTQTSTAGQNPAITQDEILKTVGAYLDAAAEAEPTGTASAAPPEAQTAASPAVPTAEKPEPVAAGTPGTAAENAAAGTPGAGAANAPVAGAAGPQTETHGESRGEAEAQPEPVSADAAPKRAQEADSRKPVIGPMDAPAAAEPQKALAAQETAAAETAEATAPEAPQYAKENVLRIVDKVSTHAAEGKYDFDVELKPEFLGRVSIKVTMEGGSIRMHIKTEDMSVKGMLTDQAASLQDALRDKGITLARVDVSYESQASLSGEGQPFERGGGGRQSGVYHAIRTRETAGVEPAAEPYGVCYVGNSSVEFLA